MNMKCANTLFVVWQDSASRMYFPVGRLSLRVDTADGLSLFDFVYIRGVKNAIEHGFQPFQAFPDYGEAYRSNDLFPFFANRIVAQSRVDYGEFVRNLGLEPATASPIAILARSGGRRVTDSVEMFGFPGNACDYEHEIAYYFLLHGLSHMPDCTQYVIGELTRGEQLFLMRDLQNPVDRGALLLRTRKYDPVGFIPRYLLPDVTQLLDRCGVTSITVERVNPAPAPAQQRLLCKLVTCRPDGFEPCSADIYQPIDSSIAATLMVH